MYVCMYVCIYIYIYIYTSISLSIHIYIYICIHMFIIDKVIIFIVTIIDISNIIDIMLGGCRPRRKPTARHRISRTPMSRSGWSLCSSHAYLLLLQATHGYYPYTIYIYICDYTYVCLYVCMYVCMYVCVYIYIYIHIYIYIYIYIHIQNRTKRPGPGLTNKISHF